MKIAIIGYGEQGRSAYEYWRNDDNEITVCDADENLQLTDEVTKKLGPGYLSDLDSFDLIVRSPAVHPKEIVTANSVAILEKVTSNTNEFFRVCPSKNIIGVTGTKGKGTTSTLIAKILEAAGKRVHLGGNIGIPPLDLLKQSIQPDDIIVLELANFQLIDLKYSPPLAVCLMVVPEHLDWHENVEEYINAKQQLFRAQKPEDIAIFYPVSDYSKEVVSVSRAQKIPYLTTPGASIVNNTVQIADQTICRVDELKLLGKHNWQNVCAAVTASWQITPDREACHTVLASFAGLEHRLELVRELTEVTYYDDSFGTTPETAIVAIEAFQQPKVLILGGSDKGASYEQLAQTVKDHNVRAVITIGATAPSITEALRASGYTAIMPGGTTMSEIVATAKAQAQPGDVVLLSTACASFDLFKDYKDRGEQFQQAVRALE